MATLTINHTETFTTIDCSQCGVTFALTADFEHRRRQDHVTFYCPNGHGQVFSGKSDVQIEKEKAIRLQQMLDQERAAATASRLDRHKLERRLTAAKGQQTKLRKRIAAGTCPECDVSFADLASHMAHEHPAFDADENEPIESNEFEFADGI